MLIADGGGGGGTDWAGMSIEMMRTLIQNPNIEAHYKLLTGWQRSYELVSDHMAQVIGYRDNLMTAWPPAKSAAATAYRDRLNDLIADLNATYKASVANHDAFASATMSISAAQHDFEDIWREHEANKAKLADFQNDVAMSSAATFDTTPPVTAMQQEAVRQKAITLMSSVSSDLAQAQVQIVRPTPYQPPTPIDDKTETLPGVVSKAPTIPRITPRPVGDGGSGTSSVRPPIAGPTGTDTAAPGRAQPTQPGLILGGTGPQVSTPVAPTNPLAPPPLPNGSSDPLTNPALLPGQGIPKPSQGKTPFSPGKPGPARGMAPVEGVFRPGAGVPGAMPPGGIIGGPIGGGLSQPGANRPGARRVNPIGGMIGEGESTNRPGARSATPYGSESVISGGFGAPSERSGGPSARRIPANKGALGHGVSAVNSYGPPSGRRTGKTDHSETRRWDPENPWETAEGVNPIVLPPKEQRIDPGPVIGLP